MITSFQSDATAALYHALRSSRGRRMAPAARARLLRRLDMINAAHDLDDLRSLRDTLAELGDEERRGQLRIGVDGEQWISFRWEDGGAIDVAIDLARDGDAA